MSRMASKLKSSSNKRKGTSPVSSRSGTPTTSQSSVSDKQQSQDPSIDEPLISDEINSLQVTEEQLRKIFPITDVTSKQDCTLVFVKETSDLPEKRPSTRNVTVLHPLPQGIKPSKTKLLGSLKAGPRYNQNNVFVSHSIIGTIDEYASSRAIDKHKANVSPPSTVPPIVLPKVPKTSEKQLLIALQKETNALLNWDRKIKERENLQRKIAKRINSHAESLTMNQSDTYRRVQEERSLIDRTIPAIDNGKGFYVGSEFWKLQSVVGDDLRTTLTKTEKGEPSNINFISKPFAKTGENDIFSSWSKSQYLVKRKEQLLKAVPETQQYPTDISSLYITGSAPHSSLARPSSLDSLGEESILSNDGDTDNDDDESLRKSVSLLDVYPDVSTPPITGPALKVKDHLLVWNESSNDDIQIRVIFDAGVNELAKNEITLKNCGTVGITFSWTYIAKINPLGTTLAGQTQRFYFDTRGGIILPGKQILVPFMFKSPNVGIYSQTWQLVTKPVLCGGKPVLITLKGIAFQEDLHQSKRKGIQNKLDHEIIEDSAKILVNKIVAHIHTPPRVQTPLPLTISEESIFCSLNPKVFYHYNVVQELKTLYLTIYTHLTAPEDHDSDVKSKKVEDKNKKDKSAKDKKEPNKKLAVDDTKENNNTDNPPIELNIPPWDLSLGTLKKCIMEIEDANDREEKLAKLNEAITSLNYPPSLIPRSTKYIKIYFLLCEAVDQLVHTSDHLQQTMGLPTRDVGIQEEESSPELDTPSQPASPAAVVGRKDAKKGIKPLKEKEQRPISRKNATATKASKKSNVKTGNNKTSKLHSIEQEPSKEDTTLTPKVSEIDPSLNEKYRQIFYLMTHNILKCTVEQMVELLTEHEH